MKRTDFKNHYNVIVQVKSVQDLVFLDLNHGFFLNCFKLTFRMSSIIKMVSFFHIEIKQERL